MAVLRLELCAGLRETDSVVDLKRDEDAGGEREQSSRRSQRARGCVVVVLIDQDGQAVIKGRVLVLDESEERRLGLEQILLLGQVHLGGLDKVKDLVLQTRLGQRLGITDALVVQSNVITGGFVGRVQETTALAPVLIDGIRIRS